MEGEREVRYGDRPPVARWTSRLSFMFGVALVALAVSAALIALCALAASVARWVTS